MSEISKVNTSTQSTGMDSYKFTNLLAGGINDSTSTKIANLKAQLSSGTLSPTQKTEVAAQISKLQEQETNETEQQKQAKQPNSIFAMGKDTANKFGNNNTNGSLFG